MPSDDRLLIAELQQYQLRLGCYALLSQAPAVIPAVTDVLGDINAETSLEDIIQRLVARNLARQVEARRARRA
jgi:HEAT repeat protein